MKQRLDHEQAKRLQFVVMATDGGLPPRSASATVVVTVTDLNDNPPRFDQSNYEASISDQSQRGQLVTVVLASDADSSDQVNIVLYTQ